MKVTIVNRSAYPFRLTRVASLYSTASELEVMLKKNEPVSIAAPVTTTRVPESSFMTMQPS